MNTTDVAKEFLNFSENKRTRGHKVYIKDEVKQRVVNHWNALPNHVVISPTLKIFESRLDKHWAQNQCYYDHRADNDDLYHCRSDVKESVNTEGLDIEA